MVTWFFENHQFTNAWIPFDRINQKKLEYVYRHHEAIILKQEQCDFVIDPEEEDPSIHPFIQSKHNCVFIVLTDTHFEQPITVYPILLLGSLPERDILIIRADHSNNKYLLLGDD